MHRRTGEPHHPGLYFAQYPDAHALAQASEEDVAELIKTGLWRANRTCGSC